MIGFYNYTVILTYISLLISSAGVFLAMSGNPFEAVLCLLASGVCDMFDGKIARTRKKSTPEERRFGIQIDSLCDIVCFGVLPFVIGVCIGAREWWQIAIMALFALAGLIRLAYFNVTEETRQKQTNEKRKHYLGVPITSSALTVPLLFCFRGLLDGAFPIAYTLLLLVNGMLFVVPLQVKKPSKTGLAVMLVIGIVCTALIIIFK